MSNRAPITASLFLLSAATLGVVGAACSGGGGGGAGEPCCTATGSTEQPTPGAASGPLFAQAFVLSTSQCFALDTGLLDLSAGSITEIAGPVARVADDGTYEVTVDSGFEGRRISIRIFGENAGGEVDYGLGFIPFDAAPSEVPFRVAPIRFDDASLRLGESTLELGLYCRFKRDDLLQQMDIFDVRAAVTPDIADGFVYAGNAGADALADRIPHYRHAMNSLVVAASTNSQVAQLRTLRRAAEALVDSCKDGDPNLPEALDCPGDDDRRAEFYRYWMWIRVADDLGVTFAGTRNAGPLEHVNAFAYDLRESVAANAGLPGNNADPAFRLALERQASMARFEAADFAIRRAASCYRSVLGDPDGNGVCDDGPIDLTLDSASFPSISTSLATLRATIAEGANTASFDAAWSSFGVNVSQNFGAQSGIGTAVGANQMPDFYDTAIQQGNGFQVDVDSNPLWTNATIRQRLYDATNPVNATAGAYVAIKSAVDGNTANTTILGQAQVDKDRITDILFYSGVNAVPQS